MKWFQVSTKQTADLQVLIFLQMENKQTVQNIAQTLPFIHSQNKIKTNQNYQECYFSSY